MCTPKDSGNELGLAEDFKSDSENMADPHFQALLPVFFYKLKTMEYIEDWANVVSSV